MDPERRRRVEDIYRGALEREGPARAAYLDSACPDPEVRREVEALLDRSVGGLPSSRGTALDPGTQLGPYRIEGPLGEGGMATVYKAFDTRLNRTVAIKVGAERFSDRFEREARAIAALNHPFVCTLYDIGPDYLVMEFVDGVTVRDLLREKKLPVEEALQYALQVASAMATAHAAGIIHRDLKPGNVMITSAGLVKVLDFGLAKLTGPAQSAAVADATATVTFDTRAGAVVGTPSYMSPEQALGKPIDARSDVFAFGLLVYEMLAGQPAFRGDSALEILSATIHLEAPPPSSANPAVDPALDAVVARCLRKDPADRYPGMAELHSELKKLVAERSTAAPLVRREGRRSKRRWIGWAPAIIAVGLLCVAVWRRLPLRPSEPAGAPAMWRVTSDAGLSIDPAISQDGRFIVYASDRGGEGHLNLWLQQIKGGDALRLTHNQADDSEPNFSPDGTHIVFRSERQGGGIYIIPTTGGEERRIADEGRRPQYSPDGQKLVYWTGPADPFPLHDGMGKIFVMDMVTFNTQRIRPDFAAVAHPVWSPDGNKILFEGAKDTTERGFDWWLTPLDGRPALSCPVSPEGELFDPFAWQGKWVYFSWIGGDVNTVCRLNLNASTGKAKAKEERLTASTADAYAPSVSKNGTVVFSVVDSATNLYSLQLDAASGQVKGALTPLTKQKGLNIVDSISADGSRVAFISDRLQTNWQVWGMDLASGREHPLTERTLKMLPVISPDGRFVAWKEPFTRQSFFAPFDGGPKREICSNCRDTLAWSADGKYILFATLVKRKPMSIFEVATGKTSSYLHSKDADLIPQSVSSDGQWLAFTAQRSGVDFTVYVAPFAPDHPPPPSEWVEIIRSPEVDPDPRWSPDGNLLYFSSTKDGYNCVWAVRLNPQTKHSEGGLFPVEHFHTPSLQLAAPSLQHPGVSIAADKLVVSLKERSGGIWMLNVPGGR